MVEIHKNNVIHRDLKPDNIFIDKKEGLPMIAKIGDFGLARMLNNTNVEETERSTTASSTLEKNSSPNKKQKNKTSTMMSRFSSVAGTEAYMAPEIKHHYQMGTCPKKFSDMEVNKKQDIFSIGLLLYEICHKMKTNMQRNQLFRDLQIKRELSKQCPLVPGVHVEYDMILVMTQQDPHLRPSSLDIKNKWLPKWGR